MSVMSLIGQKLFDTLDVNKDGSVSLEELVDGFKIFDKNADGSISLEEWADICVDTLGWTKDEANLLFAKFFKNSEGNISPDSFRKTFSEMDNNGDGVVTKDEFEEFWKDLVQ